MKLSEILKTYSCLKNIMDDNKINVDILCKFRLLGLLKSLEPYIENFEIIKNEKILKYGKTDKENGTTFIDKDDTNAINNFNNAMNELINSNIDLDIKFLKPDDIIDKGIPSHYLINLYNFIKDED